MKRLKLDAEVRVAAAIYAGQVVIFALGAWHFAL
jgi:hypothetical protein